MSVDGIAALVFVVLLGVFLWVKRDKVRLQGVLFPLLYVVMYRSRLGLKAMERMAKRVPRLLKVLGDIGTVVGFLGMVLICVELVRTTVEMFATPEGVPGIQPVLPIEAKGVFFVPFLYWIVSIFLLAVVHEFAHGVIARVHKMPVKSSGFAFLGVVVPLVPAAFVEPEEKVLKRRSFRQQWSVFAAGPFANVLFALLMVGVVALFAPALAAAFEPSGVEVVTVVDDGPAAAAGIEPGMVITGLGNQRVMSVGNVSALLTMKKPGEALQVATVGERHEVTLTESPRNESRAHLGVQLRAHMSPREDFVSAYGAWLPPMIKWLAGLVFWLFMLNLGIGLFNLLPIGPLDGGRMFQLVCFRVFKKKATALRVWSWTSVFFVVVILVNIFAGLF